MNTKVMLLILAAVGLAVAGYFYWQSLQPESPLDSAADTLEQASESVPEITTNPVENGVTELNPIERTNPFKYENPLR